MTNEKNSSDSKRSEGPASPATQTADTSIVRFWREWSAAGPRWRGWVEHVQSGEEAAFLDLDEMLRFIRRFAYIQSVPRKPVLVGG